MTITRINGPKARREHKRGTGKQLAEPAIIRPDSVVLRGEPDALTGAVSPGLPPDVIEYRGLTNDELSDNSGNARTQAPNSIEETHLITTADNSASVSGQAMRNQIMAPRHFPIRNLANGNQNALPTGLWVGNDNIADVGAGKITGVLADANIPNLGPNKLPGLGGMNGSISARQAPGLSRLDGKIKAHSQIDWGSSPSVPALKVKDGYPWDRIKGKPKMSTYVKRGELKSSAFKA